MNTRKTISRGELVQFWVGAVILTLLALIIGGILWAGKASRTSTSQVCTDSIVEPASRSLDPLKVGELKLVAEEIKQLKRFDRDPDCLYILVVYSINSVDTVAARQYFASLKEVYDQSMGFDPRLQAKSNSLAKLEDDISSAETSAREAQENSIFIPNMEQP